MSSFIFLYFKKKFLLFLPHDEGCDCGERKMERLTLWNEFDRDVSCWFFRITFKKDFIYLSLERGEEGEKEREKKM